MPTIGSLATVARSIFGDTPADYLTDTVLLAYYDQAQARFCSQVWPLYRYKGFSVAVNQETFTIPSENIIIEVVLNQQSSTRMLKYVPVRDFFTQKMATPSAVGTPTLYTHFENKIHVWPRYGTASKTTTTGSAVQASHTSISLASNANLRSLGKVIINSEEIDYTTKGSVFVSGAARGDGGTTAASHASGDTVTQLDLDILHRRAPIALAASTSTPEIPAIWHDALSDYVLYLAYTGEGQTQKANFFMNLFQGRLKEAADISKRKTLELKAIRSINSQRIAGLYGGL